MNKVGIVPDEKFCKDCANKMHGFWRKRDHCFQYTCTSCQYQKQKEKDPQFYKARYARLKARDPDHFRKQLARRVEQDHEYPVMKIARRYGLTLAERNRMEEMQNGVCAICKQPQNRRVHGNSTRLCIDHDHITGRVRALLCDACNNAIGKANDDPELLRAMADYVEYHKQGGAV